MKVRFCLFTALALTSSAFAQKKPVDHTVYDNWKSISSANISPSGSYIFYSITPQEGNSLSVLKNNENKEIITLSRGYNSQLTKDEGYFVSLIKPTFEETRQAKIKRRKRRKCPKIHFLYML